ncbi:DNA primase [Mesorhizobium sp. CGMCC 1.15528]|uniref:DNA primase n=1 Tax=Mesorhizobium zhangyense TaxID=1776730 RepID=A0A7C9RBA5_9HYPH|nr:bifunctional DNA primase/polymerase [Mesorhizobium zhangyense]NGN44339.1 DNA primase [Mesorhizobium zhangyense]
MPNTAERLDPTPTEIRLSLIENGYLPIPVDGKRPRIAGWSSIKATPASVTAWERGHADHQNTGVLTGDVVAIDIDAMDPATCEKLIDRLLDIPDAGLAPCRTGMAPKCLFVFRAVEPREKLKTGEYSVSGKKCQVEVLGIGQQFVAFGIHPDTSQPYTWSGGDLLSVPFSDLPEITPYQIDSFLQDAEAILTKTGTPLRASAMKSVRTTGNQTFWQRVNTAALDTPDAWVRDLFPSAHKEAGTGAWRVTSSSLGRGLEEDISIHSTGVQDFGLERPETPIGLVQQYGSASNAREAAHWLCEQLGVAPVDLGWNIAPVSVRFGASTAAPIADNDDESDNSAPEPASTIARSKGLPEHLCFPPGAVGDFARFIVSCARFPSPHLALVASLAFTAGLIGRRYKGPTGLRSNLYIVGLAESGFGKDVTIRASAALADSTSWGDKVSEWLFMDQIRSLPGLTNKLRKSPSSICIQDEFGRWLGDHAGRNVATHRAEIATALMELTGAPQGFWGGQEKAGGNIARIVAPCFSLHGISTPSTFWAALSSGNISEGLLGRLVLIDVGDSEPVKVRRPAGSIEDIPAELSEKVAALLGLSSGRFTGPFFALNAKSDEKPYPIMTAAWAEGVDDVFEAFDDRIRSMKTSVDPQYRPILNRVGENAARLALIVAVGTNPKEPIITREIQEWANAVAEHSLRVIISGATDNIADNEKAAEYLRVRAQIVRRAERGITMREIVKNIRGALDKRRLEDIISMLMQAGEVIHARLMTDSGQTRIRYWAAEHLPKESEPVRK